MKTFFITISILFLLGCETTQYGNLKVDDTVRYMQLKVGESTKKDIFIEFGQPFYVVYDKQGNSLWEYSKTSMTANPINYVPLIGLLALGAQNTETEIVIFEFDQDAILTNIRNQTESNVISLWNASNEFNKEKNKANFASSLKDEMNKYSLPYDESRDAKVSYDKSE